MPAQKAGGNSKRPRYITPIFRFRKERLEEHFLDEEDQFVDRLIGTFKDQLEEKINGLIDKPFTELTAMFTDSGKLLREHGPVDFDIDSRGRDIRTKLEQQIPYIEDKVQALKQLLPVQLTDEDESLLANDGNGDAREFEAQDLGYAMDNCSKRKRRGGASSKAQPSCKRIKHETA